MQKTRRNASQRALAIRMAGGSFNRQPIEASGKSFTQTSTRHWQLPPMLPSVLLVDAVPFVPLPPGAQSPESFFPVESVSLEDGLESFVPDAPLPDTPPFAVPPFEVPPTPLPLVPDEPPAPLVPPLLLLCAIADVARPIASAVTESSLSIFVFLRFVALTSS